MALRAILCQNGGEVFTVEAARGRPPTSCTKHGGTGVPEKSFRLGSKAGENALKDLGAPVKARADLNKPPAELVARLNKALSPKDKRNADAMKRALEASKARHPSAGKPGPAYARTIPPAPPRSVPVRTVAGSDEGLQTLVCKFNGHTWTRVPTRGMKPQLCPDHKGAIGADLATAIRRDTVPSDVDDDVVDFSEELFDTFPLDGIEVKPGYKPTTTPAEQRALLTRLVEPDIAGKPPQPKRRTRQPVSSAALVAPSKVETPPRILPDPDTDDSEDGHRNDFWCDPGQHWHPRKSTRGRKPRACDEHKDDDNYQRGLSTEYRANAEERGAAVADSLISQLRARGTDLASNAQRFQLQRWLKGRTWENLKLTADPWGVKHWLTDDDNAHQVKIKRLRWIPITQ